MHGREHLVDQHIMEFESRQRHVDELLQRAERRVEDRPELQDDLTVLQTRHTEPTSHEEDFRQGEINAQAVKAIKEAGPMGIWYGVISELESLLEGLEK